MGSRIASVSLSSEKRIKNEKGDIQHFLKSSCSTYEGFGEAYFSQINPGQTKGWKKHRTATLNLYVVSGEIRFVIHDSDEIGSIPPDILDISLNFSSGKRLTVPPGLWMAFSCVSQDAATLINISSESHEPGESDNVALNDFPVNW